MKDETKGAFIVGLVLGAFIMGICMTFIGKYTPYVITTLRSECELNIPRNQNCVMQFVPEKVKQ